LFERSFVSEFTKTLLKNIIQQIPAPTNFAAHSLNTLGKNVQDSQHSSLISSVASGLWTVMTLGYGGSQTSPTKDVARNSKSEFITHLPNLASDAYSSANHSIEAQIDCTNRLLAWQSCHILLILSNHCTNESLHNPYRLALFHFTDTQGN
jgi:hypothetical protein